MQSSSKSTAVQSTPLTYSWLKLPSRESGIPKEVRLTGNPSLLRQKAFPSLREAQLESADGERDLWSGSPGLACRPGGLPGDTAGDFCGAWGPGQGQAAGRALNVWPTSAT